ncbi:MAG TPA: sulfotransferase [Solirubrobacteraceae bacterium]
MSSNPPAMTDAAQRVGRVPDFFIVGHHKSGTTAMYEMLRRHPQIYMPEMKEPEYFGRTRTGRREALPGAKDHRPTFGETRPQTYEEYLSLFAAAAPDQRVGEASPSYLRSLTAARDIAAVQPAARIVAILREPVSFLYSLHLQMVRNHVQRELDFGKALASEGVVREDERVHMYTDRVRYVEQLRRYHDVFSSDQILVLIYDDFRADNEMAVRRVLRLLDVEANRPIEQLQANPTMAPRSKHLDSWLFALRSGRGPVSRSVKATVKALVPRGTQRKLVRTVQRNVVYAGAPPLPQELTLELRKRFKPEVEALGEYLDRDMVGMWGYGNLR